MSCWPVNSFELRGKITRALQHERSFSSSNEFTDQQDMFCFNHLIMSRKKRVCGYKTKQNTAVTAQLITEGGLKHL